MRARQIGGAVALAVLVLAAVFAVQRLGLDGVSAAGVQDTVRAAGAWAPAVFVALQVLITIPPVPRTLFTLAAGLLFGSVTGVVLAVVATTLAAVVTFGLVRITSGGLVER